MIKIGLDLDNCIFDSEPIYKQAFEGTKYSYFLPTTYMLKDTYPEEVVNKLSQLFATELTYNTKPYDITLASYINDLIYSKKCEFHVITARKSLNDPKIDSYNQLQKYNYQIPLSNIYITTFNKIPIILKYNLDYMIDDNPHVIEDCLSTNTIPILLSNEKTLYNHYLRKKVIFYTKVKDALKNIIH